MKICGFCKKKKREGSFSPGNYGCKICRKKRRKIYYRQNRLLVLIKAREYAAKNREKARMASRIYRYVQEPRLGRASLPWVRKGDIRQQLINFYSQRPYGYTVDHIIPINGKDVSGLHVPWNLQYLPWEENRIKRNHVFVTHYNMSKGE